jgi:hypothetical protein
MELRQEFNDLQEYETAHEKARSGEISDQEAWIQRPVFGSHEAHAMAVDRRRRMSLGSQMELFQNQIETQVQPRPKSFMTTTR